MCFCSFFFFVCVCVYCSFLFVCDSTWHDCDFGLSTISSLGLVALALAPWPCFPASSMTSRQLSGLTRSDQPRDPMAAMLRLGLDDERVHERISCAGPGPRWRAMGIEKARRDPMVWLGDQMSAAAQANDAQQVQSLLDQGADPNHIHFMVNPNHPLCRTTSPEVAKVLLAHPKIDVNVKDTNGFSILCRMVLDPQSNVQLVEAILNHEDLDVHESCPIGTAARFASVEMMRLLLDHPNLDINDPCGLLHCAMRRTDPVATDLAASWRWLYDIICDSLVFVSVIPSFCWESQLGFLMFSLFPLFHMFYPRLGSCSMTP